MNKYNPNIHHRRSIRLKGYDYSQAGLYFITINVQNRKCLFGEIINKKMILNDAGKMVEKEWLKLPYRFKNIQLHEYVVMPDHFHAILEIVSPPVGTTLVVVPNDNITPNNDIVTNNDITPTNKIPQTNHTAKIVIDEHQNFDENQKGVPQEHAPKDTPKNKTVGDIVGAFQSIVTVEYIRGVKTLGWQPFNRKLWQRNYWEHIIRNEQSYQNISEYIASNPEK